MRWLRARRTLFFRLLQQGYRRDPHSLTELTGRTQAVTALKQRCRTYERFGGWIAYESRFDTEAPLPQVGHGVWDAVERSWIAQNLAGDAASWHAAILNLRYTETGERPNDCAWYRDPAPHVELRITASRTETAKLHMWVREPGGLHGYVTYLERPARDGGRWAAGGGAQTIDAGRDRPVHRAPSNPPAIQPVDQVGPDRACGQLLSGTVDTCQTDWQTRSGHPPRNLAQPEGVGGRRGGKAAGSPEARGASGVGCRQPSAVSRQPSAVSRQPSAARCQLPGGLDAQLSEWPARCEARQLVVRVMVRSCGDAW